MGGCCSKTKEEVTWQEKYGGWVCRWEVVMGMVVMVVFVVLHMWW